MIDAPATTPTTRKLQPLRLLLLIERRLEREALTALVETDGRFVPMVAPSLPVARRSLEQLGDQTFAALVDQHALPGAHRELFVGRPPVGVVALRGHEASPCRLRNRDYAVTPACRETPWREIARQLLIASLEANGRNASSNDSFDQSANGATLPVDKQTSETSRSSPSLSDDEQRFALLTRRERQVLELIASGASVKECAESLHIASSTVDNHKSGLMKKVGARKSSELVGFAYRLGIVK